MFVDCCIVQCIYSMQSDDTHACIVFSLFSGNPTPDKYAIVVGKGGDCALHVARPVLA